MSYRVALPLLLVTSGLVNSKTEARRLIRDGAVEINGTKVSQPVARISEGAVIKVGKHRFGRITGVPEEEEQDG